MLRKRHFGLERNPYHITDQMRAFRRSRGASHLFKMKPMDFLRLTTDEDRPIQEFLDNALTLDKYNQIVDDEPDLRNGDIYLDIALNRSGKVGKVHSHEGRHRCAALLNAGEDEVEVSVKFGRVHDYMLEPVQVSDSDLPRKIVSQFAEGFKAPRDQTVEMRDVDVVDVNRRYNPGKRMSDETWKAILVDILDGGLNLSRASEKHGVPVSTISARLKKRPYAQGLHFSRPWAHGRDKHGPAESSRNPSEPITQEHPWGCGVACVAYVLGMPYPQALALFTRDEDVTPGYHCPDIVDALAKGGLEYEWYEFHSYMSEADLPDNSIVFVRRCPTWTGGHWLVKTEDGWMNPWINLPSTIQAATSGFITCLPDVITHVVVPIDQNRHLDRRFNPDEEMRRIQRRESSGDFDARPQLLIRRIRIGELDPHHVRLAAFLGHEASLAVFPENASRRIRQQQIQDWDLTDTHLDTTVNRVLEFGELDPKFVATLAVDFAEHVLPIWEEHEPYDNRPALAIKAARYLLSGTRTGRGTPAFQAASAYAQAAFECYNTHDQAAGAAEAAGCAVMAAKAAAAPEAVDGNVYRWAINTAAHAASDRKDEQAWQRQHFIEVLLA
jgi:Imm-5 like putative immunity protein